MRRVRLWCIFPVIGVTLVTARMVGPEQEFYRSDLDLSFELDLRGRLRRPTEAGRVVSFLEPA